MMTPTTESKTPIDIPKLPSGSVSDFIPYLSKNPSTPIAQLLEPYKEFESQLRKVYSQQPNHKEVQNGTINLIPIFAGHESEVKIRARSVHIETDDARSKYIMPLTDAQRKPSGTPAIVSSLAEFQQNFNIFSESSLADLDWRNVVAAGSAVTTALLPVPKQWADSKRSLRKYYHEHLAPASDVDLFLYGLDEVQACEKIKQIERHIKDTILHETTTIRTKNAITIASQYPTRHVQIVLRLYDSISQIVTGFDVDCACVAFNGNQVYAAPRAVAAFVTQCNTVDLTRRSPSYENRLSKYSHRGFEVHWPLLERSRIDPTIFERSFGRTQGLARLLVLEKLPTVDSRDSYMLKRRSERGRPLGHQTMRNMRRMRGNIKDQQEDEIAEWVHDEDVSHYHTMSVPYGEKFHAAKINRLLYAKDLLLNAEWNQEAGQEVYLHRHPCFFGTAEEVLKDCCGNCPIPVGDEQIEVAEDWSRTNVSGDLKFLRDDPGRQEIGSFNPITDEEWTTMAYVGDTARLCQAIVDGDLEHVEDWCFQEGVDVNRRDYTGRTPLHLAVMTSTPEIVNCLVEHGARLIARLVDGRTALHIAAARGSSEMVQALINMSLSNEADEDDKEEALRMARKANRKSSHLSEPVMVFDGDDMPGVDREGTEITLDSDDDIGSMTTGSFVKVKKEKQNDQDAIQEDSSNDPDVYDINSVAWDSGLSPLHFALLNGHLEVINLLVSEYGADVLLPVKIFQPGTRNAKGAIFSLVLAMSLPKEKMKAAVKLLLELGATPAQADMYGTTVLDDIVARNNIDALDILVAQDGPAALRLMNKGCPQPFSRDLSLPLVTAIKKGYPDMVHKLLASGAKPVIDFDDWVKAHLAGDKFRKTCTTELSMKQFRSSITQPVIVAAVREMGKTIEVLLAHGADPSTLENTTYPLLDDPQNYSSQVAMSLLDIVQKKLKELREYETTLEQNHGVKPETIRQEQFYIEGIAPGTYQLWMTLYSYQFAKRRNASDLLVYQKQTEARSEDGSKEKKEAIVSLIQELQEAEECLIEAGAKPFVEIYPDIPKFPKGIQRIYPNQVRRPLTQPREPFKASITFQIPDLNPIKQAGYLKLFEAVFSNDIETVKELTLAPWGTENPRTPPLAVAVKDGNGFSPFSIAVLCGNLDLARKIVEISMSQYHKDDGLGHTHRWNIKTSDSTSDNSDDDEGIPLVSELVSNKFTCDVLADVSSIVNSDISPLVMIEWEYEFLDEENPANKSHFDSMLGLAVRRNDVEIFKFILDISTEQQVLLAEENNQTFYNISEKIFYQALRFGRTEILAEMISSTGVGIPLSSLTKASGAESNTKPKYYQGLTVSGKKRADWAQGPVDRVNVYDANLPPLLRAANLGSVESVEWFMSDAPLRRYREFASRNKGDERIQALEQSEKGFENTLQTWLDAKNELVLHCAILYRPRDSDDNETSLALIKHLLLVRPELLEQTSSEGWTPLRMAVIAKRNEAVSYLISIGANERHRDKQGRNAMHDMVTMRPDYFSGWSARTDSEELLATIQLFDKECVKQMLLERCIDEPGALTPLALWISRVAGTLYRKVDIVEVLSRYSTGEDLDMINGQGDTPLHVAVMQNFSAIASFLVRLNPSILYRENASGRTPLEMSHDLWTATVAGSPPALRDLPRYSPNYHDYTSVVHRPPILFARKKKEAEAEPEGSAERTFEILMQVDREMREKGNDGNGQMKRKLVSLFEANEVARRLTKSPESHDWRNIALPDANPDKGSTPAASVGPQWAVLSYCWNCSPLPQTDFFRDCFRPVGCLEF